jgi:hypothetical protein
MLRRNIHFCNLLFAFLVPVTFAQEPDVTVQPRIPVNPEVQTIQRPDAKQHFDVTATVTRNSIKVSSVKKGDGPPRAYLSSRSDVVVLVKDARGNILSQSSLADPLEIRVRDSVTPNENRVSTARPMANVPAGHERPGTVPMETIKRVESREHVVHVSNTQLRLFLPSYAEAATIEFRQKDSSGKLLGKANVPR